MSQPRLISAFLFALFPLMPSVFGLPAPAGWSELANCRLSLSEYSDGDSFYVVHDGKTHLFRLYFVDCPETDDRFPDRLAAQGEAFGLGTAGVMAAGRQAAKFTTKLLARPFTVYTKWVDARGASKQQRFYAVIMVGGKNIASELIRNGWARAYGMPADFPTAAGGKSFAKELRRLQAQAIREKAGAFSGSTKVLAAGETEVPEEEFIDHESELGATIIQDGIGDLEINFN